MDSFLKEFDNKGTYFEYTKVISEVPTIFIHGVGLDNTMWYPQKKKFENKPVIFYDILNHGRSLKGFDEITFEDFNKQLNSLLNYLKIDKINLVGFSIGALIAQHFVIKNFNKIKKLILIGSVYNRTNEQIEIVMNRYKKVSRGESITIDSINRWFNKIFLENNPKVYNFFYELLESNKNKNFLPAYKVFVESDKKNIDFSNFKVPTLIMTGENEVGSTPKMSLELHKKIQNSILYIISEAKHGATIEKADEVNDQIKNFLFI